MWTTFICAQYSLYFRKKKEKKIGEMIMDIVLLIIGIVLIAIGYYGLGQKSR